MRVQIYNYFLSFKEIETRCLQTRLQKRENQAISGGARKQMRRAAHIYTPTHATMTKQSRSADKKKKRNRPLFAQPQEANRELLFFPIILRTFASSRKRL